MVNLQKLLWMALLLGSSSMQRAVSLDASHIATLLSQTEDSSKSRPEERQMLRRTVVNDQNVVDRRTSVLAPTEKVAMPDSKIIEQIQQLISEEAMIKLFFFVQTLLEGMLQVKNEISLRRRRLETDADMASALKLHVLETFITPLKELFGGTDPQRFLQLVTPDTCPTDEEKVIVAIVKFGSFLLEGFVYIVGGCNDEDDDECRRSDDKYSLLSKGINRLVGNILCGETFNEDSVDFANSFAYRVLINVGGLGPDDGSPFLLNPDRALRSILPAFNILIDIVDDFYPQGSNFFKSLNAGILAFPNDNEDFCPNQLQYEALEEEDDGIWKGYLPDTIFKNEINGIGFYEANYPFSLPFGRVEDGLQNVQDDSGLVDKSLFAVRMNIPTGETCDIEERYEFRGVGLKNFKSGDNVQADDIQFLGSNGKLFTQIILDRIDGDESITNHLFNQFCNNAELQYDVNIELNARVNDGNLCTQLCVEKTTPNRRLDSKDKSRNSSESCQKSSKRGKIGKGDKDSNMVKGEHCRVSDLPIFKKIFAPENKLPKFISSMPADLKDPLDFDDTKHFETVTSIPTHYTLRHFGTNQVPLLEGMIYLLGRYLGTSDEKEGPPGCSPASITKGLIFILSQLIPTGTPVQLPDPGQDPILTKIIEQIFLNDKDDGPSFPLLPRLVMRKLMSLQPEDAVQGKVTNAIDDYARIFQEIPLLADIGHRVKSDISPNYGGSHPYNNDHDLIGLSLSGYFGVDVAIGCESYDNILDYIQVKYMEPLGITKSDWFFPGSLPKNESPNENGETIPITLESQFGSVRGVFPLQFESYADGPFAALYAEGFKLLEEKYNPKEAPPFLGQGSLHFSSSAWSLFYHSHYLNHNDDATRPRGYTFADDNSANHSIKLFGGQPARYGWSTLGNNQTARDEDIIIFQWGAYAGGNMRIVDKPTGNLECNADGRDVTTVWKANMLDIFGIFFESTIIEVIGSVIAPLLGPFLDGVVPPLDFDIWCPPTDVSCLSGRDPYEVAVNGILNADNGDKCCFREYAINIANARCAPSDSNPPPINCIDYALR